MTVAPTLLPQLRCIPPATDEVLRLRLRGVKQAVYDLVSLCYKLVLEFRLATSVDRAREAQAMLNNEDMFGVLDSLFCGATSHKILGGSDMLKAVFKDVTE